MRKALSILLCSQAVMISAWAQQSVGIGTTSPASNYMLHVLSQSTQQGLLVEGASSNATTTIRNTSSGPGLIINKPAGSSNQGIYVEHQGGNGPVAQFVRLTPDASGAAVIGYNNSSQSPSPGVFAFHEGTGDVAMAGRINNTSNPFSAVYAETNGSGSSLFANQLGTGRAVQAQIGNPTNTQIALRSFTSGLGKSARLTISNPTNADTALLTETNGSGPAFAALQTGNGPAAFFRATNASSAAAVIENTSTNANSSALRVVQNGVTTADALYVEVNNATGSAGNFWNNNPNANISNLFSAMNSPGGSAIGAANFANGMAFSTFGGGVQLTTTTLASGTTVATRATGYLLTGGGPYTLSFTPNNGELMYVYNSSASAISFGGTSIAANTGVIFMVMDNVLRPF